MEESRTANSSLPARKALKTMSKFQATFWIATYPIIDASAGAKSSGWPTGPR